MPTLFLSKKGFTLVELLVVIAIIAILSVVGVVVFKGVTTSARDAKRKADLNAISKAYEIKYTSTGFYQALADTDFAGGAIPKTPEGNNYPCLVGPDESNCTVQATDRIAYCVSLGDNQSAPCYANSSTCYCSSSTQGSSFLSGGSGEGGSNPSCDPYGILTSDLVGYWKMDEGRDNTVADASGNNITGTLINSPVWIPTSAISPSFLTGLSFNGVSQYIVTNSNPLTNFIASGKYTISAWVYLDQYQPNGGTSGCCGSRIAYNNSGAGGFDWRIWNNGTLSFYRPGTWCAASSGNTRVPINQWVNLVATYNNQQVYLYMNGDQIAQRNNCNFLDSTAGIRFNYQGGSHGLYGDMDDLRIYNRALFEEEVQALYNDGQGCIP